MSSRRAAAAPARPPRPRALHRALGGALAAALATSSLVAPAHATSFWSGRAGFTLAKVDDDGLYAASAGASFEATLIPDSTGVRLGADAVLAGFLEPHSGYTLGLRPELSVYPGRDAVRLRPFATLRLHVAPLGLGGAEGHWLEGLDLGPELEWRHPADTWLRLRLGTFLHAGRDAGGALHWAGVALALTVEYGTPTTPAVQVPSDCIPLPTRPCP